ncbi:polar amino acid transport system substrate-binding protein [Amycolatopsis arida]|uniref:Polar amino acid transport system substrate-binding protein n=1 Tax=Amycolatopsis arida TaxID=587909 RepID=A0A1I5SL65_9PSEU|nr:glutamate ABC transporter substrate-binding protein [Amycolatopsis arida]TDX96440.1 polar amino acid transport system substrate-binding protein [Amycolatopsis arida]SFP71468.1 polar amino acid transport system substrate-binding protein [Amycolatopsis arida]
MRLRTAAVLAALGLVVAGCGSPGAPVDPAPVGSVQRPMPPNAGVATVDVSGTAAEDCDATASLPPQPGIPAGSTMDKIRKRGHLIAGVDQNTFLFGFRNPTTGKLEGFDVDIAKEVARAIFGDPEKIRFRAITSAQREPMLENREVDIVVRTYTINCERLKKVNFSSVYYIAGQRVLVHENSDVGSLADLGGQRVCASRGSTSLKNIARSPAKPVPVQVDDWSDCLVLLQQGQVAAISTDDTILAGMAQQDPTTKIVGEKFTQEPYGIGIPKGDEDMVRFVNAVLEEVRAGTWQRSYDTWLAPRLGPATPPAPTYR